MWTRKELKEKGRETFKRNYWKCVLVALILGGLLGGANPLGFSFGNFGKNESGSHHIVEIGPESSESAAGENAFEFHFDINEEDEEEFFGTEKWNPGLIAAAGLGLFVIGMLVFAGALALDAFVFNPIELGCDRFFYKNLDENTEIAEVAYGFDHGYGNIVKIMFIRDIRIILWMFLLIIPGIIKAYEYRMIPYLLAERPDMSMEEAFTASKNMMHGQKWRAFVLDLSFIGWDILSLLTIGILGLFYVNPYKRATQAALYETLRIGSSMINEA